MSASKKESTFSKFLCGLIDFVGRVASYESSTPSRSWTATKRVESKPPQAKEVTVMTTARHRARQLRRDLRRAGRPDLQRYVAIGRHRWAYWLKEGGTREDVKIVVEVGGARFPKSYLFDFDDWFDRYYSVWSDSTPEPRKLGLAPKVASA